MASLVDNPDLNHLGTGPAAADFLAHHFDHLDWRMLVPVMAGWCHGAQSHEIGFKFFFSFVYFPYIFPDCC